MCAIFTFHGLRHFLANQVLPVDHTKFAYKELWLPFARIRTNVNLQTRNFVPPARLRPIVLPSSLLAYWCTDPSSLFYVPFHHDNCFLVLSLRDQHPVATASPRLPPLFAIIMTGCYCSRTDPWMEPSLACIGPCLSDYDAIASDPVLYLYIYCAALLRLPRHHDASSWASL
ncbi:hypothetical protein BC827DRAFT_1235326 [Russula dissimulans]|nr:hypothetical protein BC827DRAFT_1235326 [Russula dissimulans]